MPHIERLQNLYRVVENAPEERWDMAQVGHCKTARCAYGHSREDRWFQREEDFPDYLFAPETADYFGISEDDLHILFGGDLSPSDEVSRLEVLANIRRLMRGEPAQLYVCQRSA